MWPFACDLLMVKLREYFVQRFLQLPSFPKACVCVYNTNIQIKHAHTKFFHNSVQKLF